MVFPIVKFHISNNLNTRLYYMNVEFIDGKGFLCVKLMDSDIDRIIYRG